MVKKPMTMIAAAAACGAQAATEPAGGRTYGFGRGGIISFQQSRHLLLAPFPARCDIVQSVRVSVASELPVRTTAENSASAARLSTFPCNGKGFRPGSGGMPRPGR